MSNLSLPRTAPWTKQEFVYQTLREQIMRGEIAPGERLVIDEVARQLSVSAIPVREALQSLRADGLVTIAPHVGAVVAPVTVETVLETFTIMEGLELVTVRVAAERLDDGGRRSLREALGEMDLALEAGDQERWADLNTAFHTLIVDLTGMPLLREFTARALSRWDRVRRHFFQGVLVHRTRQAQQEHHAIVRALEAGDLDRLEELVRGHNRRALAAYLEHIGKAGVKVAARRSRTRSGG